MEIREAVDADIPAIVDLLKKSLGEELMPKSEEYWRWKHVENPFGKSPILIAIDKNVIAGVRAFMCWQWHMPNGNLLKSVRAVDTATHPDYQGKGIFKKLTLSLLDRCKQNGTDFVFNTPNASSKPGYLKMGWVEVGKLPVNLALINPANIGIKILLKRPHAQKDVPNDNTVLEYLSNPGFRQLLEQHQRSIGIVTNHSIASLSWRYLSVPVARYHAAGVSENDKLKACAFYRLKYSRAGVELRITDVFATSEKDIKPLRDVIAEKRRLHAADFITSSVNFRSRALFRLTNLHVGPVVTVREIGNISLQPFREFNNWAPSLGDLELF